MSIDEYIRWLCKKIMRFTDKEVDDYNVLCNELIRHEFDWRSHPMDENRANDGLQLRKEFELEHKVDLSSLGGCTVLEMMVALADTCEDRFMRDINEGNRTKQWFFVMLDNLGIRITNDKWTYEDGAKVSGILENFMKRRYLKNGKGGLFPLKNPDTDQRNVQIWGQLVTFLNENYLKRDKF